MFTHTRHWHTFTLTAVLLTAAALRLVGLNNGSPPGLAHDEVANWLIDRSILAGEHAIYFTRAYGHEAGFHYVQAAFVGLLGDHALALRLPAAFLGLLGVAVSYALAKRLFGRETALITAALLAVLFWPVFYSRLGLRAIMLPVTAGLSALCFWQGLQRHSDALPTRPLTNSQSRKLAPFALAGLFAGLSTHTYMAARALPIFYALFLLYLALWHRDVLRRAAWGMVVFTAVYALVSAPLLIYLWQNPGAEFRISEVDAPLQALREGNILPILRNGWRILIGFGFVGDPLWRQNVAGAPVFSLLGALCFYGGVGVSLWRWRDGRSAFALLWLVASAIPSLVTVNAPSTIRMILVLPLLPLFPAIFIHSLSTLSTVFPRLSTEKAQIRGILALTICLICGMRTLNFTYRVWPQGGDVPFVWQSAFTEMATALAARPSSDPAAIAGWSPDTMDPNTFALLLAGDAPPLSHFNPEQQTLLLPAFAPVTVYRPTALPLHPTWEAQLAAWGADVAANEAFTRYTLAERPFLQPQMSLDTPFGDELALLGVDVNCAEACVLVSYWRVLARPSGPRRLFMQGLTADGSLAAETYHWDAADPQGLWFAHWQVGDLILQRHELANTPAAAAARVTAVRIGVFDPTTCTPGPCQNVMTAGGAPFLELGIGD